MTAIMRFHVSVLGVVALFACGGCNTVAGFGQDVAAAGQALTSAARKVVGADGGTPDEGVSGSAAPPSSQAR
jgi:predicted small secreted protein